MPSPPTAKRSRFLLLLLTAVLAACATWLGLSTLRPQRMVVARLEASLDNTPELELTDTLRQIASFGQDGIPALVRALAHDRAAVAEEARLTLSEELDAWQFLPRKEASRRLAVLAAVLAEHVEQWPDAPRRVAGDFATRILLWPTDAQAIDQQQLLTDCQHVLTSVASPLREAPTSPRIARTIPATSPARIAPHDESLIIPGGNLPHEAAAVPVLAPEDRLQPQVLPPQDEPHLSPVINPGVEPRRFFPETSHNSLPRDVQPSSQVLPAGALDNFALVRQLGATETEMREAAEEELRQRGFSEPQLLIARRFADPDPRVRRRLVNQLASQSVVDPRLWLMKLLEDKDRQVRLSAASVLATNSDPQVIYRLRERALIESDAEVRSVLERATE